LTAGKQFVKKLVAVKITNYTLDLLICIKPSISALGHPLQMAVHALDWGYSLYQRCRGGKRLTMVMMFVGGLRRCSTEFPYFSYRTKPLGQKFSVSSG
jgi:hypothetical protein